MSERAETPKTLCPECGFVAGALFGILAGLVLAVAFWPRSAEARWSAGAAERITEHRDLILLAADVAGVDPVLLASIAAHETLAQAIPSGALDADGRPLEWGTMQIRWRAWGRKLRAAGVATRPEDLLDTGVGYLAGAWVLAYIQRAHTPRTPALLCCMYSIGEDALRYLYGCGYSQDVEGNLPRAAAALWRGRGR